MKESSRCYNRFRESQNSTGEQMLRWRVNGSKTSTGGRESIETLSGRSECTYYQLTITDKELQNTSKIIIELEFIKPGGYAMRDAYFPEALFFFDFTFTQEMFIFILYIM